MATSVDEKVVQLTIDNKQFNEGAGESIDSLDKLKKALEFDGAMDSFDKMEKEIKKVDFNPLESGVEAVKKSWTALDTIVDATLRNMTNRMIDTGERMIKSLTVDQISQGWDQYAERTGAVQTIMAATAAQFDDTSVQMEKVNEQLDKLTWFTDETSHKFNDMVSGIGKFTANNVGLETSVKAMQGIATWASLSGANTNEASRAIYNLAQAVSVGAVKLIDWRSIENANMGTTEFKNTVIETAEAMGTLTRAADGLLYVTGTKTKQVSLANFSENLSEGWFSSDVLLKALEAYGGFADELNSFVEETGILTATAMNFIDNYVDGTLNMSTAMQATGMDAEELTEWLDKLGSTENDLGRRAFRAAQETKTFAEAIDYIKTAVSSGWATSFTYIFGDYLEAKEWWSEIAETMYEVFVVGGEIRNEMLSLWKEDGGREDFLEGIRIGLENIMEILDIFKSAWREVWYGEEAEQVRNQARALVTLTKRFRELMVALKPTSQTVENLHIILTTLFNVLKTGLNILKSVGKGLSPIAELLNITAGTLLQVIADVMKLVNSGLENIFTEDRLNKLTNVIQLISQILSGTIQVSLIIIFELVERIINAAGNLWNKLKNVHTIQDVFNILIESVSDFFKSFSKGETFANSIVNTMLLIFGGLVEGVKKIINTIVALFTGEMTFSDILNGVDAPVSAFTKMLDDLQLQDKVKNVVEWIGMFIDALAGADGVITKFVRNITDVLSYFWTNLGELLSTLTIKDIKDFLLIAILWQFIGSLTSINKSFSRVTSNFAGTIESFNLLIRKVAGQSTILNQISAIVKSTQILQIVILVHTIVEAFKELNTLDYKKTQESAAALGVTLAILLSSMAILVKIMDKFKKIDNSVDVKIGNTTNKYFTAFSQNVIAISASLLLVIQSFRMLNDAFYDSEGTFDWKKMLINLGAVSVIAGALVIATNAIQKFSDKSSIKSFLAVVSVANGLSIVVKSIAKLATIDTEKLIPAVNSATNIIIALGLAVMTMSKISWQTALSLVPLMLSFSTAILEMTVTLGVLSSLVDSGKIATSIEALAWQIVFMTASIGSLGVALRQTPASTIMSIGLAMIEFSTAIGILSVALKTIENYDWEGSKDAIWTLGVAFTVMSGALAALGIVLGQVSADRITAIGLSMDAFAASVLVLAISLRSIQGIAWNDISAGVKTIAAMAAAFTVLAGIVAFVDTKTFGAVSKSIETLSSSFLKFGLAITAVSAGIFILSAATGLFAAIIGAIQALASAIGIDLPTMISTGFDTTKLIISEFLSMLRDLAPDFFATFAALFGTIVLAIQAVKHPTALAIAGLVIEMANVLVNHGQEIIDALVKIIDLINNAKDLFRALEDLAFTIGEFFGAALIKAIIGVVTGLGKGIIDAIGGIFDKNQTIVNAKANTMMSEAIASLNNKELSDEARAASYETISNLIAGFAEGSEDLSDMYVKYGLEAMKRYEEEVGKGAYNATTGIKDQIAKGTNAIKDDVKKSGELIGQYQLQGYIDAQDPAEPMDQYRYLTEMIGDQVKKGMASISGDLYNTGASGGKSVVSGFTDVLNSLFSKYGVSTTKLVEGFGTSSASSKNPAFERQKAKSQSLVEQMRNRMQGIFEEAVYEPVKEMQKEVADIGLETGEDWVENLSKGATSSKSKSKLSSAGKENADTLVDAFADEINALTKDLKIQEKVYRLWSAENPYADDLTNAAKEVEYLTGKVEAQTKMADIARTKYEEYFTKFGEASEEAQEAYSDWLDLQIEALELQNKLNEAMNEYMTLQTEAAEARERSIYDYFDKDAAKAQDASLKNFQDTLAEWQPYFKYLQEDFGYTEEQIWRAILKDLGQLGDFRIAGDEYLDEIRERMYNILERGIGAAAIKERYGLIGNELIEDGLASGIEESLPYLEDTVYDMNDTLLDSFDMEFSEYYYRGQQSGENIADGLTDGITSSYNTINDAARNLGYNTYNSFNSSLGIASPSKMFRYSGQDIGNGLILGMQDMESAVTDMAIKLAVDAYEAARRELEIRSPSRKMEEIGKNFDLGFANGIDNYSKRVETSVNGMIGNLIESTEKSVSNNQNEMRDRLQRIFDLDDNQLSMTVVIDADTKPADRAISELERMQISGGYISSGVSTRSSIRDISGQSIYQSRQFQKLYNLIDDYVNKPSYSRTDDADQPRVVNVNMTQNNTSPKAISRVDTYRDTQRLITTFANKFGTAKRF